MTIPAAYSNARYHVTSSVFRLCQKLEGNVEVSSYVWKCIPSEGK
jgi:hypothetical protein